MFCRGIGAGVRQRRVLMHRGDVHNSPPFPLLHHLPRGNLRTEKRAVHVNGENVPPVVKRHLKEWRFGHRPGIVDQYVKPTETRNQRINGLCTVRQRAQIKLDSLCTLPPRLNLATGFPRAAFIGMPCDTDIKAALCQHQRGGFTDTGIRCRYNCYSGHTHLLKMCKEVSIDNDLF